MAIETIRQVSGTALPLPGDNIDTDRIIPARFLRSVSFEGLEQHLFTDDRAQVEALGGERHPFSDPRYDRATILVVNANFGCGSSREHAPQGLARFGITAIVGESFSEIFLGNSAVLGIPCLSADHASIDALQSLIERAPESLIEARVDTGAVTAGSVRVAATIPPGLRDGFVSGQWNPTAMLLERFDEVRAVADTLPYVSGFQRPVPSGR